MDAAGALLPKPIGFIAYFLLRRPLPLPCPNCQNPVAADFATAASAASCWRRPAPIAEGAIRRDFACCPYCGKIGDRANVKDSASEPGHTSSGDRHILILDRGEEPEVPQAAWKRKFLFLVTLGSWRLKSRPIFQITF